MDPLIVAEKIAETDRNRIITTRDISAELNDGGKRVGGSFAKGKKWNITLLLQKCNKNVIIHKR